MAGSASSQTEISGRRSSAIVSGTERYSKTLANEVNEELQIGDVEIGLALQACLPEGAIDQRPRAPADLEIDERISDEFAQFHAASPCQRVVWRRGSDEVLAGDDPSDDVVRRVQERQESKIEPPTPKPLHQPGRISLSQPHLNSGRDRVIARDQGWKIEKRRQTMNRPD